MERLYQEMDLLRSGEGRNLGLCLKSYQLGLLNLIFEVFKARVSSWGIQVFCLLGVFGI